MLIDEALFVGRYGRLRTVVEAPDGSLYTMTSNRDEPGTPRPGDDRLLRIIPPAVPRLREASAAGSCRCGQ